MDSNKKGYLTLDEFITPFLELGLIKYAVEIKNVLQQEVGYIPESIVFHDFLKVIRWKPTIHAYFKTAYLKKERILPFEVKVRQTCRNSLFDGILQDKPTKKQAKLGSRLFTLIKN